MRTSRVVVSWMLGAMLWTSGAGALAQSAVDPDKVRLAAEEFDAGRRAYKSGDFARAASYFEDAFRDAPSVQALRMAIRARFEGKDGARAATLCMRAQELYPQDRDTQALVERVLAAVGGKLQKVSVQCEPACTLVLDGKLVRDEAASLQSLYVTAGAHDLVMGWSNELHLTKHFDATEGAAVTFEFSAPKETPQEAKPSAAQTPITAASKDTRAGAVDTGQSPASGKLSPTLFWVGTGLTAALGGITIWSGLDTRSSPGPDAVKQACVGQGQSCSEYQDGLSKQRRTNYLLAGTVGAGIATGLIGLFWTDWNAKPSSSARTEPRSWAAAPQLQDGVGVTAWGRF